MQTPNRPPTQSPTNPLIIAECNVSNRVYDQCGQRCKCVNGRLTSCHRVRKDFTSMTSSERARYIRAYKTISTSSQYKPEFDRLIQLHSNLFSTDIHQTSEFLPWHRWYLLQMENLLKMVDCRVNAEMFIRLSL